MKKNIDKEKEKNMRKLTQKEFIDRCKKIHGDNFDYSKSVYINTRTKVTIICHKHGEFEITPTNHINQKQGCWDCFLEKHRLVKLTDKRIKKLRKIHNNKYKYINTEISKGFINIECPIHGIFKQYLYFHEYGHGCSECNSTSRGEDIIKSFLENEKIKFHRNYQFEDCKRKRKLKFDFYLPDFNHCIEYDGEHHFKENKYFGEGNLKYIKENDMIKNNYCESKKIGITRIPYYEFKNIENILSNVLKYLKSS